MNKPMGHRLEGKVAVITGGTSGIGLATAQRFVDKGAHVFIVARRQEGLDEAVATIGKNVTPVQADVTRTNVKETGFRRCFRSEGTFSPPHYFCFTLHRI